MRFIQRGRAVKSALAATAIAAAMAATAGNAFAAGNPADDATKGAQAAEQHRAPSAKGKLAAPRAAVGGERTATFPMAAVERDGWLNWYFPDGRGGFEASWPTAADFSAFKHYIQVDQDKDGQKDGAWSVLKDGQLLYTTAKPNQTASTKAIGGGWQIYNKVLSPATSPEPASRTCSPWTRRACCGSTSATTTAGSPPAPRSAAAGASTPRSPARAT